MRALAVLVGLIATVAGALRRLHVIARASAPRTAPASSATATPHPARRRHPAAVQELRRSSMEALERELGADGGVQLAQRRADRGERHRRVEGRPMVCVQIDASGRSQSTRTTATATPSRAIPVGQASTRRRSTRSSRPRARRPARRSRACRSTAATASGGSRCCAASPTRSSPTSTAAACASRASRTPSRSARSPDSLLRAEEPPEGARRGRARRATSVLDIDVWPERVVGHARERASRDVSLSYGYDAQLTGRDMPRPAARPAESVALESIDPKAIERMAKTQVGQGPRERPVRRCCARRTCSSDEAVRARCTCPRAATRPT